MKYGVKGMYAYVCLNGVPFNRKKIKLEGHSIERNLVHNYDRMQDKGSDYWLMFQNVGPLNLWGSCLAEASEQHSYKPVVSGFVKQGGGSPDEARLEQTPYPFQTH